MFHHFYLYKFYHQYINNDTYKVYKKEVQLITIISDFLLHFLLDDTVTYTLDENSKNEETGFYTNL